MALPPLLRYASPTEYREHFERHYCRGVIVTFDDIRVHFAASKFGHCFYESSTRDGRKDVFSPTRAERMDWIRATLEHPKASLFEGWNKDARCTDPARRVAVVHESFVVVVELGMKKLTDQLKANFVTCYQADNSIEKIRASPVWSREACLTALKRNGR